MACFGFAGVSGGVGAGQFEDGFVEGAKDAGAVRADLVGGGAGDGNLGVKRAGRLAPFLAARADAHLQALQAAGGLEGIVEQRLKRREAA